jgi:hypothetical protein
MGLLFVPSVLRCVHINGLYSEEFTIEGVGCCNFLRKMGISKMLVVYRLFNLNIL